ncbi:MAG: nucleoside kinase [Oscillospiraceae bacterium]|nr:nucleoside kinase [Oscillospiraceae bacterium]
MAYDLSEINMKTVTDPKGFCEECEAHYNEQLEKAAEMVAENLKNSPVILLAGPSGSAKTTTAMKLSETLKKRGIGTHYISMDDYFFTVGEKTPRTPEGDYDLESPLCLDMELMNRHFEQLERGERIFVPKYEFSRQMRVSEPSKSVRLKKDEICIFEGIHALNDKIAGRHAKAFKIHVSANSNVMFNGRIVFKNTWFRLVRRTVRDYNFRGADPAETMAMWANVRRGEKLYITPYKKFADFQVDSVLACEMAVMNHTATKLFQTVPEGVERYEELRKVLPAIQLFGVIKESDVPYDSVLREFIGGGIYS